MKKKIIAIFGILSLITFAIHTTFATRYFVGAIPYSPIINILGIIFVLFITVHGFCAITDMIRIAKKTKNDQFYGKYIADHAMQNISGIGMYISGIIHAVAIEVHHAVNNSVTGAVWFGADVLLYAFVCIHLMFALPHILLSMGIVTNSKTYKIIRYIVNIVSIILLIMLVNAHIIFMRNEF